MDADPPIILKKTFVLTITMPAIKPKRTFGFFTFLRILLINILFPIAFISGCVVYSYMNYLDDVVRTQFNGKRWEIPARVYASPMEMYVSSPLREQNLLDVLTQLRYRQDKQLSGEGTYVHNGNVFDIKTKPFVFSDFSQPSITLRIEFANDSIKSLTNLSTQKAIDIFRLDPVQIGSFYPSRKEDRILIKLEDTPRNLLQGLFATEDHDFYNHFGVSPKGILRALMVNAQAGSMVQGGSTLTQQLVKNFFLTPKRNLMRKVNEALMSIILEYRYTKNEILEAYLNEIFLGQDGNNAIHGFGLASEFYFGQSLKNLDLAQTATLIALVRGPSYYDPRRNSDRSIERRNLVLDAMRNEGYINDDELNSAKSQPLNVLSNPHQVENRYPAFIELVKRQLKQSYKDTDLTTEGLRIFTTLDVVAQDALENAIQSKLQTLEKSPKSRELESSAVVTRRDNGEIVALAGGRDADEHGFNRALDAMRPIGSLIKPIIYLTALNHPDRYNVAKPVSDTKIIVNEGKPNQWEPDNYDNQEHGIIPLHTALSHSYNLATVRIGMDIGLPEIANTLKTLGVDRSFELYPSFLLGASPLTPLEVSQAYLTISNDGFLTPLRSIRAVTNASGHSLTQYSLDVKRVIDSAPIYLVNTIMQEVVSNGTAHSAYNYLPKHFNLAGKTGTTNGLRDSWFAGYSGDFLSVVWVGRDDNNPTGLTGGTGALQVWGELMKQISRQGVTLNIPDNITMKTVDKESGLLMNEQCPGTPVSAPFITEHAPIEMTECLEDSLAEPTGDGAINTQMPDNHDKLQQETSIDRDDDINEYMVRKPSKTDED